MRVAGGEAATLRKATLLGESGSNEVGDVG